MKGRAGILKKDSDNPDRPAVWTMPLRLARLNRVQGVCYLIALLSRKNVGEDGMLPSGL